MKIEITQFSGVSPRTPPRYLETGQAQTAINCPSWNGSLTPIRDKLPDDGSYFAEDYVDPTYVEDTGGYTLGGVTADSVYLFGTSLGVRKWFHWDKDTDVVRGYIAGDTNERTFFTQSGMKPQSTDATMNAGLGPYPENSYDLSVPPPTTTLTATVTGTATPNAVPETRVYTYTWVNNWGDETMPFTADPMPASAYATVADGQSVNLTLPAPPTGNFSIVSRRIYRSAVGSDGSVEYLFVAEVPATDTAYTDTVDPSDLGEVCPSINWNPVPDNLIGLVGSPNGFMAGFIEGGRDIYFSEPYHPYAWPVSYSLTLKHKIVGLAVIDTTIVALTEGKPVLLQGSHPSAIVQVEADVHQACVSKRSIVVIMGSAYYASPDGIVRINAGGSELITRDFFSKEQWKTLNPETLRCDTYERRYIGFYNSTMYGRGGFVFDIERGKFVFHDIVVDCTFNSLIDDKLYVIESNVVNSWDAGAVKEFEWKSKKFTFPRPAALSALRVDSEGSGVRCRVIRDGKQIVDKQLTARRMIRLPSGKGKDWEFILNGTEEVFALTVAESPAEIGSA